MRIIDVCDAAIRTVAISPDGRFVAVSSDSAFSVLHWTTGEVILHAGGVSLADQIVFAPDSRWVIAGIAGRPLRLERLEGPESALPYSTMAFAGGVAVSPDGKTLVATQSGEPTKTRLECWSLPAMRPQMGFDCWSPFRKLAFSPDGQYIAGIWPGIHHTRQPEPPLFELRFAVSGGQDCHYPPMKGSAASATGFVSFTRDSTTCAFGWENEFHILDTSTGTSRYLRRVEASFRDAGFTGSGHLFATVEESGRLKMWDVRSWQVMRDYDWGCGPLTCLAFTADGSAGVCGTSAGKLVQFDVDE